MKWKGIVGASRNALEMRSPVPYLVDSPEQSSLNRKISEITMAERTLTTNSGMAAIEAAITSFVKTGDRIICSEALYSGASFFLHSLTERWGVVVESADFTKPGELQKKVIPDKTKIVYAELIANEEKMTTVSCNDLLEIFAGTEIILVVDTTFTPFVGLCQRASEKELSVVEVGSITKYEQREDVVAGGRISASSELIEIIQNTAYYHAVCMQPLIARVYLEDIDKMPERFKIHSHNCLELANLLAVRHGVKDIFYPGLSSHPGHRVVMDELSGLAGGVLFLKMAGKTKKERENTLERFIGRLLFISKTQQLSWEIAASLGSSSWRILPFIGASAQYMSDRGIARIAVGRADSISHLRAVKESLDAL